MDRVCRLSSIIREKAAITLSIWRNCNKATNCPHCHHPLVHVAQAQTQVQVQVKCQTNPATTCLLQLSEESLNQTVQLRSHHVQRPGQFGVVWLMRTLCCENLAELDDWRCRAIVSSSKIYFYISLQLRCKVQDFTSFDFCYHWSKNRFVSVEHTNCCTIAVIIK